MREDDIATLAPDGSSPGQAATRPGEGEETLPGGDSGPVRRPERSPSRGTTIGKFVVDRELGAGAMGIVLLAIDPELDRRVAIKLLWTQDRSDVAQIRLLREAQSAARVQHPNVVAIHHVGTHDEQVYVVMEYVDGGTLGRWLATPRTWSEIVETFVQAGRGLAAAHAAGLVHRDFKPENVLVGRDGRVRVSDFGLVGLASDTGCELSTLSSSLPGDERLTRTGALMGTPAYMSPEQLGAGRVDARSDQFAFCVALYEALFGMRPFAGDTLASLAAAVCEGEPHPPPPSDVPQHVRRAVLRGLARAPGDRHASMDALLAELLPAVTAPRRGRLVASGVLLFAVGAGAAALLGADPPFRCPDATSEYGAPWGEAQRDAAGQAIAAAGHPRGADAIARIDRALERHAERWARAWNAACAARIEATSDDATWARRAACLRDARDELHAFATLVSAAEAAFVDGLVVLAPAVGAIERCDDPPPSDPAAPGLELRAAQLRLEALEGSGLSELALEQSTSVLDRARELGDERTRAELLAWRGHVAVTLDRLDAHEDELQTAVKLAAGTGACGTETHALAALLEGMSRDPDRGEESRAAIVAAAAVAERCGDVVARLRLELAMSSASAATGDAEKAHAGIDRAIEALDDLPAARPALLSEALLRRASLHLAGGDRDAGRRDFQRAHEAIASAFGSGHPLVGLASFRWGSMLAGIGDHESAVATFTRSTEVLEAALGPEHPATLDAVVGLGRSLLHDGQHERALPILHAALDRLRRSGRDDPARETVILENLGWLDMTTGRTEEAIEMYERTRDLLVAIGGESAERAPQIDQIVGWAWWKLEDMPQARAAFERARAAYVQRFGPKHDLVLLQVAAIGDTHAREGDCDRAQAEYRKALKLLRDLETPAGAQLARVLLGMGECELLAGDLASATDTLGRAYELRESPGLGGDFQAPILFARARLLARQGDRATGRALAREALEIYRALPVAYPREMNEIETWLAQ